MSELSKTLIIAGVILIAAGVITAFFGRIPGLGRLPGDIYARKGDFSFYFPLTTCLIVSLILTLLFTIFGKK